MKTTIALFVLAAVVGVGIFGFAPNVTQLWAVWILGIGVVLGQATSEGRRRIPKVIALLLLLSPVIAILLRSLPIHSLEIPGPLDRVEITAFVEGKKRKIDVVDPAELRTLEGFLRRGRYQSMLKCASGYHMYLWSNGRGFGHYVHGGSLGPLPGGWAQSVFVPSEPGFRTWLDQVAKTHGLN